MKKVLGFVACYLLSTFLSFSQSGNWVWAKAGRTAGSSYASEGWDIATDKLGNVYITGAFQSNQLIVGTDTLTGHGQCTVYLVKYDPNGNVLWAKSPRNVGFNPCSQGTGIALDAQCNIFWNGFFWGDSIAFDNIAIPNFGQESGFLAKYDSLGNIQWVDKLGSRGASTYVGTDQASGNTVATDSIGNVYVTGLLYSDSIVFDSITLINPGIEDFYIAKYNANGEVLWAKSANESGYAVGTNIVADNIGNTYVTGFFRSDSITFETTTLRSSNSNYSDMFLVKYDSHGHVLWAKSAAVGIISAGIQGISFGVALDISQNLYVSGGFRVDTLSLGGFNLINHRAGYNDVFICKYNSRGAVIWAKGAGGIANDYGYSVATDPWGNVYMTGSFSDGGNDSITFGAHALLYPANGRDPSFIVKYDSTGHAICAAALASGGDDKNGVATDPSGYAYFTSDYWVNQFIVGPDTLHSPASLEEIFIAKYVCDALSDTLISTHTICSTQCSGTATCTPLYGIPPYSYFWSDGDTTASISGLCPGAYSVAITDHLGYSTTSLFVIDQDSTVISILTNGDTIETNPATAYQWYFNGLSLAGDTTYEIIGAQTGVYVVVSTDSKGCLSSDSIYIDKTVTNLRISNDNEGFSVYPNPSFLEATVKYSVPSGTKNAELVIYNILGQRRNTYKLMNSEGELSINNNNTSGGFYFCSLFADGTLVLTRKMIVSY